jgi:hypothetical protein
MSATVAESTPAVNMGSCELEDSKQDLFGQSEDEGFSLVRRAFAAT